MTRMHGVPWLVLVCALLVACGDTGEKKKRAWGVAERSAAADSSEGPVDGSGNTPPRIVSLHLEPMKPEPGQRVRIVAKTRDGDGDTVRLRPEWKIDGVPLHERELELQLGSAVRSGQRVEVTVTPHDGLTDGEPAHSWVEVASRSVVWHEFRLDPEGDVTGGGEVVALAVVEDPDGEKLALEYTWSVNGRVHTRGEGERGARFRTDGLARGDTVRVRVTVRGDDGERGFRESEAKRIANSSPRFVSKPGSGWQDGVFRYVMQAEDPDGDRTIRYRLEKGPAGMQVDPLLGELTWRPEPGQHGVHEIVVAASDGHGGEAQQLFELTLSETVRIEGAVPADRAGR